MSQSPKSLPPKLSSEDCFETFASSLEKQSPITMAEKHDAFMKYAWSRSTPLTAEQEGLNKATAAVPYSMMLSSSDSMQLLQMFALTAGAKKTLDIGVYTGYSALTIALVIPEDGKVVACDISKQNFKVGIPFLKKAGVYDKIDFREAPASDTLQDLIDDGQSGTFDFAYIDADKNNYETYYEQCHKLLRKGGIISIDNTIWHGASLSNRAQDSDSVAIRALNDKIARDTRVHAQMIDIGDGVMICFKK